jgi:hypothetical protein
MMKGRPLGLDAWIIRTPRAVRRELTAYLKMIVSPHSNPATPYHVGFLEVLFCLSFAWLFAPILLCFLLGIMLSVW